MAQSKPHHFSLPPLSPLLFLLLLLTLTTTGLSLQLPHFTTHPTDTVVTPSSPLSLSCSLSQSSCNITINWYSNDTQIASEPYNPSGNPLTDNTYTDQYISYYYCTATNGDWTIRSETAEVGVAFLSSSNASGIGIVTAPENSIVAIDCIPGFTAYPMDSVEYSWVVLIGDISVSDFISTMLANNPVSHGNGTLYLRQLVQVQPQQYKCTLFIDGVTSISYTTTVEKGGTPLATPTPHFIVTPQDTIADVGDTVTFYCITTEKVSVTWVSPINSPAQKVPSATSLVLIDVSHDDVGVYSCNGGDGIGTSNFTLTLRDPPTFTATPPLTLSVTYGHSLSLTCVVTGDEVQQVWYHNGGVVSNGPSHTISEVDLSHAGAYQCYVIGPTGITNSSSTLVTVETVPPMFLPNGSLTDQVVFSGTDLVLSCEATGAPMPSYQWLKDGADAHVVFGFDTSVPGQLYIEDVYFNLEGVFTCVAENSVGGETIGSERTSAHVVIIEPTLISTSNPSSIKSYIGDPFHLNCTVSHDTSATSVQLLWTRDGEQITDSSLLNKHGELSLRLNITSATASDQGAYQCVAMTSYTGNSSLPVPVVMSSVTMVEITDAPIQPEVTQVRSVGPSSLEISWTYKGFLNNLLEYQLEVSIDADDWIPKGGVAKTAATVRNVTNLSPNTHYYVRVLAILNNEERVSSNSYGPVRTGEDVPSGAPPSGRIDTTVNSSTSTQLRWEPPLSSLSNGIITDYTIRYWANGTRNTTPIDIRVGSNSTSFTLSSLLPNAVYWVQIAAHTRLGRGPFSDPPVTLLTTPTIESILEDSYDFYNKIWFILLCTVVVVLLIVTAATLAAIFRWRSKNKGNMYTVRDNFYGEELSLTEDAVADYNKKRDRPIGFAESVDGSRPNLFDTQLEFMPPFGRSDSFRGGSIRGSVRGSFRGSSRGLPPPPEYINPPSFEETLKARLAGGRSASTTLIEKVDNGGNFRGSGWSVGHDPKSSYFFPPNGHSDEVDSVVGKTPFPDPGEETSADSDTSTGFHSQSVTNVESFAQFV